MARFVYLHVKRLKNQPRSKRPHATNLSFENETFSVSLLVYCSLLHFDIDTFLCIIPYTATSQSTSFLINHSDTEMDC